MFLFSQNWTNSMAGFLVGLPVLLINLAVWLYILYRPEEDVKCDHWTAALGIPLDDVVFGG